MKGLYYNDIMRALAATDIDLEPEISAAAEELAAAADKLAEACGDYGNVYLNATLSFFEPVKIEDESMSESASERPLRPCIDCGAMTTRTWHRVPVCQTCYEAQVPPDMWDKTPEQPAPVETPPLEVGYRVRVTSGDGGVEPAYFQAIGTITRLHGYSLPYEVQFTSLPTRRFSAKQLELVSHAPGLQDD